MLHNAQLFTQRFPTRKVVEQEKNLNLDQEDVKKEKVCHHCVFIMVSFACDHIFPLLLFLHRFMKSKKPAVLIPFLPLSFVVGYQADYVHGSKVSRIRG